MTNTLDKNVPIPRIRSKRGVTEFFAGAEIGDSKFFPYPTNPQIARLRATFASWEFTQRTVEVDGVKGIRVWRTK